MIHGVGIRIRTQLLNLDQFKNELDDLHFL